MFVLVATVKTGVHCVLDSILNKWKLWNINLPFV